MTTNPTIPAIPTSIKTPSQDEVIEYAAIVFRIKDRSGVVHENVVEVDGSKVAVSMFNLSITNKMAKAKDEEGNIVGFEPTGEKTVNLKISYVEG